MEEALKKNMSESEHKVLSEDELMDIDGGLAFTGSAIVGGVLFVGGVALGAAWAFSD
ncbi:class IIb bacteriocin, lactobin A/cerein 7B family [Virgibacillus xinjiangensis]|uniref:Class IIb bacteriocin, lactobin A/cerein 7B family n=1 Tax=Virgibacillus xinjiangensis TaxID=393090 RepID=A0ABV7CSQ7_9BACI